MRVSIGLVLTLAAAGCSAGRPLELSEVLEERGVTPLPQAATDELEARLGQVRALLGDELSEESAVRIALLNNAHLRAELERLGVARAELRQAGLLANPTVEGALRFGSSGTNIELDLVQNVLGLLFLPQRLQMADSAYRAAVYATAQELVATVGEVRRAFIAVQGVQMRREVLERGLEVAKLGYDFSRELYRAGNITELQHTAARLRYEEAKLLPARVASEERASRERLNRLLGLWGPLTEWKLSAPLAVPPVEEPIATEQVERRAIERSLALREAAENTLLRTLERESARRLTLFGDASLGGSAERETDGEWLGGPALALALPLFDFGGAEAARAAAALRAEEHELTRLAVDIRSGARAARERVLSARELALFYRDVLLPLRKKLVAETEREVNAMLLGADALIATKESELSAELEYLTALEGYWLARAELQLFLDGASLPLSSEAK